MSVSIQFNCPHCGRLINRLLRGEQLSKCEIESIRTELKVANHNCPPPYVLRPAVEASFSQDDVHEIFDWLIRLGYNRRNVLDRFWTLYCEFISVDGIVYEPVDRFRQFMGIAELTHKAEVDIDFEQLELIFGADKHGAVKWIDDQIAARKSGKVIPSKSKKNLTRLQYLDLFAHMPRCGYAKDL